MPGPTGPYLVDTSVLTRLDDPVSPIKGMIIAALQKLDAAGNPLHIAPQNLIEFWNVATRPIDKNGLGMTPAQVAVRVTALKKQFILLPDIPAIYEEWERLAEAAQVSGKQVHDTKLAAYLSVHGIPNLLTLNPSDFRRFTSLAGITVIEPKDV